jgi:hypothetical protein
MSKKDDWDIPEAHAPRQDPWNAPGDRRPLPNDTHHLNPNSPFSCHVCGKPVSIATAYAFNGDMYCGDCRPDGAISASRDLPKDFVIGQPKADFNGNGFRYGRHNHSGLGDAFVRWAFRSVIALFAELFRRIR